MQHFPIVFYSPKNNIYSNPVSRTVEKLKEAGLTQKRLNEQLSSKEQSSNEIMTQEADQLSLYELQGSFLITVISYLVCGIVFGLEILMGWSKRRRNNSETFATASRNLVARK